MRIGPLRQRVTLKQATKSQSSTGAEVKTWAEVRTVCAEVINLQGREYLAAREVHSSLTTRIRIRYYSAVTTEWRVVYGSHIYDVISVVTDGRRREMELMCSEVET